MYSDAVLAVTLGLVERMIGGADNACRRVKRLVECGEADADRDRARRLCFAVWIECLFYAEADALGNHTGFVKAGLR